MKGSNHKILPIHIYVHAFIYKSNLIPLFRDFNRNNGRPVMRPEDIQPVAHEYERYKVSNYNLQFYTISI
jgi:hypothetical protein